MRKIFSLVLSFFFLFLSTLHAEVHVQISEGVNMARPIAVIPFKWNGPGISPADIADIVVTDLRNSGKFNPLDISRLPQKPNTVSDVSPTVWMNLSIDSIILGQLQPSADGSYTISYKLVDISGYPGSILIENNFKVTDKWLRYAAHSISDEIFEKLTGIKGIFRTRIAYIAQINKSEYSYELRIADYDGYNSMLVYRSSQPLMSPVWSPDGSKLAYVTFEGGRSTLVIQTLDTGVIRQVANFPQHNGAPSFSPDGSKLAFALSKTGSLNLYVMDLVSWKIRQITNDRSNNTEPTWFPDNKTLAYTSDQGGNPQIYKIEINGGSPQRLSWEGYQNQNADISLDGKFLVMVSSNQGSQHIVKLDLTTGVVQVLTDTFMDEAPSIAPNGTMLIYNRLEGVNSVLQLISIDGHFHPPHLKIDGQIKFPSWSPYL